MDRTQKKDLAAFAFIRNQILHTGVTPSLRAIGSTVGYTSPRSAQLLVERLEKQGLLKRVGGVMQLATRKMPSSSENVIDVPLVGSVACGMPTLAEQEPEALLAISTKIAKPGASYFLLRAKGTSMNRAGIHSGDLVLIRQQPTASEGEKVVALINDEATIKRFHRGSGVIILRPDSTDKRHKPIVVSENLIIQGVVAATLPANII